MENWYCEYYENEKCTADGFYNKDEICGRALTLGEYSINESDDE